MRLRGNLFLMMAAFLWGTTFVAQMTGMDNLGPFTYAASRYFLGFCSLLLIWWLYRGPRRIAKQAGTYMPGWKAGDRLHISSYDKFVSSYQKLSGAEQAAPAV